MSPERALNDAPLGIELLVIGVDLDPAVTRWIGAVGVAVGDRLYVLRRAVFGGPLHVRSARGGEFAIDRSVAAHIRVERVGNGA